MYIVFEGIDTSGKSTQARVLHDKLDNSILTKEPGGTKLGSKIRELVLYEKIKSYKCEMFLFLADRAEHYTEIIEKNSDKTIISDRSFISGISYALANNKDIDLEFLYTLNQYALDDKMPDKTIILKLSKELLKKRLSNKSEDKIEQRGIEYLLMVQENIIKVTQELKLDHIIIDASKTIDEIHQIIKDFIK